MAKDPKFANLKDVELSQAEIEMIITALEKHQIDLLYKYDQLLSEKLAKRVHPDEDVQQAQRLCNDVQTLLDYLRDDVAPNLFPVVKNTNG